MIGAICVPFGSTPVSSERLMSASLHLPMPVSRSGVMFAAFTLKVASSQVRGRPESCFDMSHAPLELRGVWQLPQVRTPLTR